MLLRGNFTIAELISTALVLLIAMTIHEFAHNYIGYRMGDPTPRDMGRLTLNPMVHINWFGWLMWLALGFGILGSAPISEYRMRDRRWGYLAAVAAGPVSNLILAALSAIPFWFGLQFPVFTSSRTAFIPTLSQFMFDMIQWNLLLFIFNLIPVFPLDGWHILRKLLPPDMAHTMERYQREVMYAFFGLILLSFIGINVFGYIIDPPYNFLLRLLLAPALR